MSIAEPSREQKEVDVIDSELTEPVWSVISFEKRESSGLTYAEALAKIAELDSQRTPGLCIVTDNAAARIGL